MTVYDRPWLEFGFLDPQWVCGVQSSPNMSRKKSIFPPLHILRGKYGFPLYSSYFSQFALLSLEAGGLYQGKQRETNNPK